MSGFQITITDAGRAALINAQNTGTVAFVLSQIGVSTQAIAGDLAGLTALPNERKRLATMAGDVVADDTLHVTIRDESADAYALRSFGLYASTGVLFAVYSQADPILEKSAAAMLLLAVDARLVALGTANVEFGPVGFTLPPAGETVAGVVEIATDAEVDAGVDPWRVITARTLKRALQALSGFALKDHKHDAADTTSGVFNVGRIPALAMEKITGLAVALANKADKDHKHDAADTTSGTFNVARIPSLAMEKITGLVAALGGKADASSAIVMRGSLGGADLDTVLAPGGYRQATAANAQLSLNYPINNDGGALLVVNPSSDTGYQTYHSRVTSRMWTRPFLAGTFYPWAEHWTSANFDPATKASLSGATFTGNVGIARRGINTVFSIDGDAGRVRQIIWQTDGVARWILQADETSEDGNNVGSDLVLMNRNDAGGFMSQPVRVKRETGEFQFARRPIWAGATPWDSANLNPASFAPSNHTHDGLIVRQTYAPGTDLNSLTSSGIIGVHANPAANLNFPVISAGALEVFASAATRVYQRYTTSSTTAPDVYERTLLGTTWSPWRKVVMDDLASTYGARGLIEMATDAEAIAGTDQERAINPYILKRRVDARAASNAETLAGSLTDKFITPSSLWSFAKSIGLNGYAQVPGTPLVIQWGRQTGAMSEGQRTVMLPIAFGGGCVAMLAIPWNSSPTADYYMQIVGRYLDRLVFMLNSASGSSGSAQGFDWLAIGFATGTPNPAYSSGGGGGGGGGGLPPGGGGEEPIIRPEV